jgi:hypothetical protein
MTLNRPQCASISPEMSFPGYGRPLLRAHAGAAQPRHTSVLPAIICAVRVSLRSWTKPGPHPRAS